MNDFVVKTIDGKVIPLDSFTAEQQKWIIDFVFMMDKRPIKAVLDTYSDEQRDFIKSVFGDVA